MKQGGKPFSVQHVEKSQFLFLSASATIGFRAKDETVKACGPCECERVQVCVCVRFFRDDINQIT